MSHFFTIKQICRNVAATQEAANKRDGQRDGVRRGGNGGTTEAQQAGHVSQRTEASLLRLTLDQANACALALANLIFRRGGAEDVKDASDVHDGVSGMPCSHQRRASEGSSEPLAETNLHRWHYDNVDPSLFVNIY